MKENKRIGASIITAIAYTVAGLASVALGVVSIAVVAINVGHIEDTIVYNSGIIPDILSRLALMGPQDLFFATIVLITIIAVATIVILCYGTKSDSKGAYIFKGYDKWFLEIQIGIFAVIIPAGLMTISYAFNTVNMFLVVLTLLTLVYGIFLCLSIIYFLQVAVKRIRAKKFWYYTIVGRIVITIKDIIAQNDNVTLKAVGVACLCTISIAIAPGVLEWLVLIAILILIGAYIPKYARRFQQIKESAKSMSEGNVTQTIPTYGKGELDKLAVSINSIAQGAHTAMENEVKNQKLKVDLITNVSHDIKTPLTSLITYVDLMKKEQLKNKKAEEYLEILEQKSLRLKKLTDDLFDAAKASSGAMRMNLEKIEVVSILNQVLGELNDKFHESSLEYDLTHIDTPIYVNADGQLLFRVLDNILLNATKYSLSGSRVYIKVEDIDQGKIKISIKNISASKLNIPPEELMERFQRGDENRTTEGSGLGLAIAQDLTKLMGGIMEIKIDGDVFTAEISFLREYMEEK